MIYVYRSAGYDKEFNIIHLIKIGYTEDITKRNSVYISHNPGIKLICTIPDLDENVEHALHSIFRKFLYPDFGREWFVYDEEIVDFFKTHTTPKSILECPEVKKELEPLGITNSRQCLLEAVDSILRTYLKNNSTEKTIEFQTILYDSLSIEEFRASKTTDPYDYLSSKVASDLVNAAKNYVQPDITDQDVLNVFNQFENFTNFIDKMKFLCKSFDTLGDDKFRELLVLVPVEYRNYLSIFSIKEISACSYKKSVLLQKFNKLCSQKNKRDQLLEKVHEAFELGKRYTKQVIKEILRQIYNDLGYESVPKATDLEEWFEIKRVTIIERLTDGSRKKIEGFEIIKIKE